MPSTLFDSAGLAIVAYAQVAGGATVSTAVASSGVSTTRISTGLFQVFLPTGLAQSAANDLIFVQPKANPTTTAIQLGDVIVANVVEVNETIKQVSLKGAIGTTAIDSDFDILILRTMLP
jgi:hypothetical protein